MVCCNSVYFCVANVLIPCCVYVEAQSVAILFHFCVATMLNQKGFQLCFILCVSTVLHFIFNGQIYKSVKMTACKRLLLCSISL
jgi:hypothetical protein